jgi:hypothetical protein
VEATERSRESYQTTSKLHNNKVDTADLSLKIAGDPTEQYGTYFEVQCLEVPQRGQRPRSRYNMQVSSGTENGFLKHPLTIHSHIFCLECANQLHLSNPPQGQRPVCPACDAHLSNPDDAVITNLNPTEDYKTSVLSGLSPTIIMECTGRALSFWAYQTSQEVYVSFTLYGSVGNS